MASHHGEKNTRKRQKEIDNFLYETFRDVERLERQFNRGRISDDAYQQEMAALEAATDVAFSDLADLKKAEKDAIFIALSELEQRYRDRNLSEKRYQERHDRLSRDAVLLDYDLSALHSTAGRATYLEELARRHKSIYDRINYLVLGLLFSIPFYSALLLLQNQEVLAFAARISVEYPVIYFTILALEAVFLFFVAKSILMDGYTFGNVLSLVFLLAVIYLVVGNPLTFEQDRLADGADFLLLKRSVTSLISRSGATTVIGFSGLTPIASTASLKDDGRLITMVGKPPATVVLTRVSVINRVDDTYCGGPVTVNEERLHGDHPHRLSSQARSFLLSVEGCSTARDEDTGFASLELSLTYDFELGSVSTRKTATGTINGL